MTQDREKVILAYCDMFDMDFETAAKVATANTCENRVPGRESI